MDASPPLLGCSEQKKNEGGLRPHYVQAAKNKKSALLSTVDQDI